MTLHPTPTRFSTLFNCFSFLLLFLLLEFPFVKQRQQQRQQLQLQQQRQRRVAIGRRRPGCGGDKLAPWRDLPCCPCILQPVSGRSSDGCRASLLGGGSRAAQRLHICLPQVRLAHQRRPTLLGLIPGRIARCCRFGKVASCYRQPQTEVRWDWQWPGAPGCAAGCRPQGPEPRSKGTTAVANRAAPPVPTLRPCSLRSSRMRTRPRQRRPCVP